MTWTRNALWGFIDCILCMPVIWLFDYPMYKTLFICMIAIIINAIVGVFIERPSNAHN
jgi:hypothetical protein